MSKTTTKLTQRWQLSVCVYICAQPHLYVGLSLCLSLSVSLSLVSS